MLKDIDFKRLLDLRRNLVLSAIGILMLVLIGNLYLLQVKYSEKYQLLSDKNRIRISPLIPKRGRILSSDGQELAFCEYRHKLVMEYCSKKTFEENLKALSEYLPFSEEDKEKFRKQRDKKCPNIDIKDDLSYDEYAKIAMNLFKLRGVSISSSFSRNYYMPLEFSHVIGYTSKINNNFRIMEGRTGIEASCDEKLRGSLGNIQKEINASGRSVRILGQEDPVAGEDIVLTIDSRIQKFIYDELSQYKVAACCVLDMEGNVVALVSYPGYDIKAMSSEISKAQWDELNNSMYKPLLDRFTNSLYPPGSIFKIVTAYAALKERIISPNDKLYCLGGVKEGNRVFHCWNRGGHGKINISNALVYSCDCYFFELAKKLGIQKIAHYARELGYGQKVGIGLPNEKDGLVPDKLWKLWRYKSDWKTYETMLVGIGQGALLTNLIQTATMFGKLYSNDLNYSPHLIVDENQPEKEKIPLDKYAVDIIKQALHAVCERGTARKSCKVDYGISGKTGSSQVRTMKSGEAGLNQSLIDWKYRDHAFFAGVAPYNNPKYIVAVLVEHGGGGSSVAAPIARKIFDELLHEHR